MIFNDLVDIIGNTPMFYLKQMSNEYQCNIYLKLEKYNLTGSSKDRAVKNMISRAFKENLINNDTTIIEASSGNTAISLASICAYYKIKCIIVMPNDTNIERINILKRLNATIVFTDSSKKILGSIEKAKQINKKIKNSFLLSQFENKNNYMAHYETSANEIINDIKNIDGFFCSCGSYGSICGIGKKLKEYNKNIKVIKVAPMYQNHRVIGINSNNHSTVFDTTIIDKTIKIDDVDTFNMFDKLSKEYGLLLGMSSCLNLCGAIKYLKKHRLKNIVVFCPDGYDRYVSSPYLNDIKFDIKKDINYMKHIIFNNNNYQYDDIFFKYKIKVSQIKNIKAKLLLDAMAIYENDPSCLSINQVIDDYVTFFAIVAYRIANCIYYNYDKTLARKISEYAHYKTSIDIHPACMIGKSFVIDHGVGIVIGETCKIGDNVRIYQNVTLGSLSLNNPKLLRNKKRHPTIKNNVIIYAGATILGGNTIIGNNVIIGCNSLITSSIKDNSVIKKT